MTYQPLVINSEVAEGGEGDASTNPPPTENASSAYPPPEEDSLESIPPVEDEAYPPPEESTESSLWQGIIEFLGRLIARFSTPASAHTEPATRKLPVQSTIKTTTIAYDYDHLYRLTAADYSDGAYFHYQYDAVGNREVMTTTGEVVTNYAYDDANRLISEDGVTYTWDDNGNLTSDGVNIYTYDHAYRLTSVVGPSASFNYTYNGLGDCLQQTVDGVTTN